jgi:hypothetical protein
MQTSLKLSMDSFAINFQMAFLVQMHAGKS